MTTKRKLSATVDADVLRRAETAVHEGAAPSVSAWVNEAMHRQMDHERRLRALDEFIAAYEAEHGPITDEDVRRAKRRTSQRAVVVRGEAAQRVIGRRRARGRADV
jgi:hypothetical protein